MNREGTKEAKVSFKMGFERSGIRKNSDLLNVRSEVWRLQLRSFGSTSRDHCEAFVTFAPLRFNLFVKYA